ncbi:unnamed protein product [Spirodela intermedia]|uniref:Uncharacterized protein n=1 Tax=Spirodela intermedia TaxID=51605 RepID=A0A7I8L984_SPIIN|nr:unnamed protein product [Spirodela intermedia]
MKWVVESSPAAVTRRSGKTATLVGWRWAVCQGTSSSSSHSKRRLFITSGMLFRGGDSSLSRSSSSRRQLRIYSNVSFMSKVTTLACMTTLCPTIGWPQVTWKGSGAHVPLSVQAKLLEPLLVATP